MCQHVDGRLVVDLSFDVRTRALTWVVTATNEDGQVMWMADGHDPLRLASPRVVSVLADCLAKSEAQMSAHTGVQPFDG
jgi:hypothetical protein